MTTEKKKAIVKCACAVLFNAVMGGFIAKSAGGSFWCGAVALNMIAVAVAYGMPKNSARAGVFTEVWTGEVLKQLRGRSQGTWLDGVPDYSSMSENDVIHLSMLADDPEVVVNNTGSYPLTVSSLAQSDIAVSLDLFQTKPTTVTDDELHALSFDKMSRVIEIHADAINRAKFERSALNVAKSGYGYTVKASGKAGESGSYNGTSHETKAVTMSDIIAMKNVMDVQGVPADSRRLVLCPQHVNELLSTNQSFREQYNVNRADGTIGRLYGFDIYEYGYTPYFAADEFAQAADSGKTMTENMRCSFAFYAPRIFKATGTTKMYYSEAATTPEYQRSLVSYRHYFICRNKMGDNSGSKKLDGSVVVLSSAQ